MKKILSILLGLLLLAMVGCGNAVTNDTGSDSPESIKESVPVSNEKVQPTESGVSLEATEQVTDSHSVLVVYFSRTGNTKPLAEYAAEYLQADLYEIQAAVPYTDEDIAYYTNCRADKEQNDSSARPEIAEPLAGIEEYRTIVLGYPIWHGQAPRIIDTFLESYDFSGKTIIPFCTSASSGIGSSATNLEPLVSDTVTWIDGKRFAAGTSKEELAAWLSGVCPQGKGDDLQMKLFFNDIEIPMQWEDNDTVRELADEAAKADIVVSMAMYSDNEQVGPLGKRYTSSDKQTTTHNGDVVLYNSNQIVVFYGSNFWAYTRLGHMELEESKVTELLANGDITLTIKK